MPTCPNGHQSATDDWCEVCGHRMSGSPVHAGAVIPPPPGGQGGPGGSLGPVPPGGLSNPGAPGQEGYGYPRLSPNPPADSAQPELCPQCRTPREAQAPFCEECRYNFLTHSPTSYGAGAPPQGGYAQPQVQQPPPGDYRNPGAPPMGGPGDQREWRPPQQGGAPAPGQASPYQAPPSYPSPSPVPNNEYANPVGQQPPPQAQPHGPPPGGYGPGPGAPGPGPVGAPGGQQTWYAVVAQDREYFQAMLDRSGPEAGDLSMPPYAAEQQFPLSGGQVTIGRRRPNSAEAPDIDLARQPEDPGVSHQHAVLVKQPDGSWSVVDQNSTNGTTINLGEEPIQPFIPIPLGEGDRVHVGAWTTITLRRG